LDTRQQKAMTGMDQADLPGWLIRDIYGSSLLPGEKPLTPSDEPISGPRADLGLPAARTRPLSLVYQSAIANSLTPDQTGFLRRMLEACGMDIQDVTLVEWTSVSANSDEWKKALLSRVMILFGTEPESIGLPFQIPCFKIQEFDGCRYLCCPELADFIPDSQEARILKSKLWICLRSLFGI
jgi:hypothetical protein